MAKRKGIPRSIRFEVFKRDMFTCQYCGRKAPDVILEVDHIKPVAKGGNNSIENLVSSCWDCNHGKGAKELSDLSVVEKSRKQIEILQQKKEIVDMIFEWKESLNGIETYQLDKFIEMLEEGLGYEVLLPQQVKKEIQSKIKKYGIDIMITALETSITCYYPQEKNYIDNMIKKMYGIARNKHEDIHHPDGSSLRKIVAYSCKKYNATPKSYYMSINKDLYKKEYEPIFLRLMNENDARRYDGYFLEIFNALGSDVFIEADMDRIVGGLEMYATKLGF